MKPSVLHVIPSMEQGGAERILASLVSGDVSVDHTIVTILAGESFFPITVKLISLGLPNRSIALRPFWQFRQLVAQHRPGVIHAWLYHGNLVSAAAAGLGVPIIWSIHNTTLSVIHSKRMTRAINRLCAVLSHTLPAQIVYPGQGARSLHEQIGYSAKRGLVINNGIDLTPFRFDRESRHKLRAELGLEDGEFAVGCVARFDPQKNQKLIVNAFTRFAGNAPGKLVLVGRECSADNAKLRSWLTRFGVADRAILLGERSDVPAVMSALDVLVIGSSYGEAAPVVALEAAASGLPIVATQVGIGVAEGRDAAAFVLSPSHIVAIEDAEGMAHAILDVYEHWNGVCRQERASRRRVLLADYSLDRMRGQYGELYRKVAANGRRAS